MRTWGRCLVLLSLCAGLLLAATPAEASHFRFGHITWKPRPDIGPNTAEFKVKTAWRRSFTSGSAPDGRVAVGDTFPLIAAQFTLSWGDGTFAGNAPSTVLSINPAKDWFLAETAGLIHTYPAPNNGGAPWLVEIDGCCRIYAPQRNAPGTSYQVQTTVNLGVAGGDTSPESTVFPIVNMAVNTLNTITIPVAELDGDTITCRLATFSESFIGNQPGPPVPGPTSALSVAAVPGGCRLTWQTNGTALGELWATQLMIEQSRGGNPPHGRVGLEFLIEMVNVVGQPPRCDTPPTPTGTVQVNAGSSFSATIQGSDPDPGDTLTLNSSGVPAGATLTPGLPTIGSSPITSVLSWTPSTAAIGPHPFLFSITDSFNQQVLCSFTLDVIQSFNPFGGITRTPSRTTRASINKPSSSTEGVRCTETDDPNNPDFDSLPFMPFTTDPLEFDFELSAGDGDKTVCCQFIDDMEVISEPVCAEITLEEACPDTPAPHTQGYWHRQCLGTGEIVPGRSGRGPSEPIEPEFVEDLQPCADRILEDAGFYATTTCGGMDADPPSDACERALKQTTALILNVCSSRVSNACLVDATAFGCTSGTIGDLVDELSAAIQSGDCQRAADCAGAVNEGLAAATPPPVAGPGPVGEGSEGPVVSEPVQRPARRNYSGSNRSAVRSNSTATSAASSGRTEPGRVVVRDRQRAGAANGPAQTPDALAMVDRNLATLTDRKATVESKRQSEEALLGALSGGFDVETRLRIASALIGRVDVGLHDLLGRHLVDLRDEAQAMGDRALEKKARQLLKRLEPSR